MNDNSENDIEMRNSSRQTGSSKDLQTVMDWSDKWDLAFNSKKCQFYN